MNRKKLLEVAEEVGLIGPRSRVGGTHEALDRFIDHVLAHQVTLPVEVKVEFSKGSEIMSKVVVDAQALRKVLSALVGPPHHVRELQATRGLPKGMLGEEHPINLLLEEFNSQAAREVKTPDQIKERLIQEIDKAFFDEVPLKKALILNWLRNLDIN